jgi:predicted ABC-type transport system involved in lysophospholipase L1 biosynthesis ATPase subunit
MSVATAGRELVVCRGVSVVHGSGETQVVALSEVDLRLRAGERVGLWGRSGSGKTTLLHVLGGLVTPTAGEVAWRGEPLSSLDAAARGRARSQGIAYVFQGANLLPTFTAYENVAFAAHVSGDVDGDGERSGPNGGGGGGGRRERGGGERGDGAPPLGPGELLGLVGLAVKLDALPAELSGGEAQRVALARALAQRPSLLLCDEPTGHLDSDTGARVLDLIDALQGRFGFAQVTATHDPDVAARYERVIGLRDGRIGQEERFA